MFEKTAIQQIIQSEATNAGNAAIQDAITGGEPLVALHEDFKTIDLEQYLALRRRARNSFTTPYVADFTRYVSQHQEHGCTIYVNAEEMAAKAVLNQGGPDEPGHGDNTALVRLRKTAPYAAICTLTSHRRGQKELAEWLEEWRQLVKATDAEAVELNLAHVVAGIRSVSIEQINNSTTNVESLSAERSEMESVKARTGRVDAVLPAYLSLTTQPYKELAPRTFFIRVSILTSERAPTFVLSILGHEVHDEEMAEEFANVVRGSFGPMEIAPVAIDAGTVLPVCDDTTAFIERAVIVERAVPDVLIGSFSVNR